MGYLVAGGFLLVIVMALSVLGAIIGLWLGQIMLFDSIVLGIIVGVCCHHFAHIHTALCIVVGIAVCVILFVLQNTTVGFWVIGGLFTLIYATFFGVIAYSSGDAIWGWLVFGLAFVIIGGLHLKARDGI